MTEPEKEKRIEGKVIATAKNVREYMGKFQLGVRLEVAGVEDWYNIEGTTAAQVEAVRDSGLLARGNIITCVVAPSGKTLSDIEVVRPAADAAQERAGEADDEVNLDSLLDAAHKRGLVGIKTEMLQCDLVDTQNKYALFKATVSMRTNEHNAVTGAPVWLEFVGHGEVIEENIKAKPGDTFNMVPHLLRFAETRAICRALRWATNNAQAAEEEKQVTK